jgi:signal transduction histidine kinase
MMHEFLTAHRGDLIERCRCKVVERNSPEATPDETEHGIPVFLDQLIKTLLELSPEPLRSRSVSGSTGGVNTTSSEIGGGAIRHGRELFYRGFTVEQVVHNYGDLCQAITDLAFELDVPFAIDEFRTLNRCLDNAIAGAVSAFNYQREALAADNEEKALNQRLGFFAHELRNLVNTATLALLAIKEGKIGVAGATGAVLDRSLVGLRILIDRSLTEVRMSAGMPVQVRLFSLADFIAEVRLSSSLEAKVRQCVLKVSIVDPTLAVDGDRDLLLSAVGNLLQNAFKFTRYGSEVRLHTRTTADRIFIDIEDHCGGLPPGDADKMFYPFMQADADRTGLGLGLAISQSSVQANRGVLSVRDVPGTGCVFTIDLPRCAMPAPASIPPLAA